MKTEKQISTATGTRRGKSVVRLKKQRMDFLTILHLAEMYQEQYRDRNLCLSPEQNDVFFRDFVEQYFSARYWGKQSSPVINTEILLF